MTADRRHEYYRALVDRNRDYEGVFYVGVRTTGIYCRPTCAARKPRAENCAFFATPAEAEGAGFRPCKRCRPAEAPNAPSDAVRALVAAVDADPGRRWTDADVRRLAMHPTTARRQFKARFGLTFVAYARARRLGQAAGELRAGQAVIDAQVASGYASGSGFREAFARIAGAAPARAAGSALLRAAWIDTPLGPMVAIADDRAVVMLEFLDRAGLDRAVERLRGALGAGVVPGESSILASIGREMAAYFSGGLAAFTTPLHPLGTPFERRVWAELRRIPAGQTRSYGDVARAIGQPTAYRAVARANAANHLAIVVPCHRVVNADGGLGGYGGGVARKRWLLEHERSGMDGGAPLPVAQAAAGT